MAAATQSYPRFVQQNDATIQFAIRLSAMTSGQTENVSYAVESRLPAAKPIKTEMLVVTPPTAICTLQHACNVESAVAASKYVPVRVYTEAGGDITGAVVDIVLHFDRVDYGGFIVT